MQAASHLKKYAKSAVALLLCCLLIVVSSYKKPVKVEAAATLTVAGCVLVAAAITAIGIGVSAHMSNESYTQKCTDIWNGIGGSIKAGVTVAQGIGSVVKAQLTSAFLHAVSDGLAKEYPNKTLQDCNFDFAQYLGWDMSKISTSWNYGWSSQLHRSYITNAYILSTGTLAANTTINLMYGSVQLNYDGDNWLHLSASASNNYEISNFDAGNIAPSGAPYAVMAYTFDNSSWKYAFIVYANGTPGICVYPKTADSSVAPTVPKQDVYNPADENFFAQGYSALNHRVDDVIDRIGALQGVQGGIAVTLSDAVGSLTAINDQIKALTQATVTGQDATDAKEKEADDTANKGRDTTVPKNPTIPDLTIPEQLTRKFPFSLPFDFVNSVKVLSAPSKPPKFTLPLFVVPAFHWNFSVTLAWEDFDKNGILAGISRWGFSLLWIIGLIFITKKLIWK